MNNSLYLIGGIALLYYLYSQGDLTSISTSISNLFGPSPGTTGSTTTPTNQHGSWVIPTTNTSITTTPTNTTGVVNTNSASLYSPLATSNPNGSVASTLLNPNTGSFLPSTPVTSTTTNTIPVSTSPLYSIINSQSGMALTASSGQVSQQSFNNSSNQLWNINGDGSIVNNGIALDGTGGALVLSSYSGNATLGQQFLIGSGGTIHSIGTGEIVEFCTGCGGGSVVRLNGYTGTSNQIWNISQS